MFWSLLVYMKELQHGKVVSYSKTGDKRRQRLLNNIDTQFINTYLLAVEYGDSNYNNFTGNELYV